MPRGKTARILALIDACVAILQDIQPATVRAVCYQLFIQKLLPSMAKTCTNSVSTHLVYARKQGIVPWSAIVDETRHAERPGTWANPETLLEAAVRQYRRDRWQHQPHRVEVWSEKGTVRGTLGPLLDAYGVMFQVAHGNTSWTKSHDAANDYRDDPRPMTILYVGDCDPSGMFMSEVDLPINRFAWEQVPIAVERLAILPDVARQLGLPAFPARDKKTDTKYKWFVREYGDTCWELDAMNPNLLRDTVRLALDAYIDWAAWDRCGQVEAAEQRSMREVLGIWRRVKSGHATT